MDWRPPEPPRWLSRMEAYARAVGGADRLVSLEPTELCACASRSLELDDFGGSDWRQHFDVLLRALRDARLTLLGRTLVRSEILRSLRNRLQLRELWKRKPEIVEDDLDAPVFIVGTPRSGTSILHELLALDDAHRSPLTWEVLHPVESLSGWGSGAGSEAGPRVSGSMVRLGDDQMQFWHDIQPAYETMHHNAGHLPTECIFITMNEFLSDQWSGCHVVPRYEAHLARSDQTPAYRFHRSFLQTLATRERRERWLLKAPSHLSQLAVLFSVYPDAKVIHTHRDPLKTLPSTLSLMGTLKSMRCHDVDLELAARYTPQGFAASLEREIEGRASGALPEEGFADILYSDLVADPLRAIAGVYERWGWPYPQSLQERIRRYLDEKRQGVHGAHRYSLEAFGLDPGVERERFAFYRERFGITNEG